MKKEPRSHQLPENDPAYVKAWAKDLVAAIGKREVRRVLADYEHIAGNPATSQQDREAAQERVEALKEVLD